MKTTSRKDIKSTINEAVYTLLDGLKISKPSKKTAKAISKASKALKRELKSNLKKLAKKSDKSKASLNGKAKEAIAAH